MTSFNDVTALIPQRAPMLMVDSYCYIDDHHGVSSLTVTPDNIFVDDGELAREALIEHIAQTAAAHAGYRRQLAGKPVCLGYIGDIKKVGFGERVTPGQRISTNIEIVSEVGNIIMIAASSLNNLGEHVCQCRMKLAMDESAN